MTVTLHPSLLSIHLEEAQERLAALGAAVDVLLDIPRDAAAWQRVRQNAHALAGNSAMMGYTAIAATAHAIEMRTLVDTGDQADPDDVLQLDRGFAALRCLIELVARDASPSAPAPDRREDDE